MGILLLSGSSEEGERALSGQDSSHKWLSDLSCWDSLLLERLIFVGWGLFVFGFVVVVATAAAVFCFVNPGPCVCKANILSLNSKTFVQ